eukprot:COSAG01_NODE_13183_length_1623_cov_4.428478_2_plen_110_part_00
MKFDVKAASAPTATASAQPGSMVPTNEGRKKRKAARKAALAAKKAKCAGSAAAAAVLAGSLPGADADNVTAVLSRKCCHQDLAIRRPRLPWLIQCDLDVEANHFAELPL